MPAAGRRSARSRSSVGSIPSSALNATVGAVRLGAIAAGPSHRADEHVLRRVLELDELDQLDVVADRLEQLRARGVGHVRGEPLPQRCRAEQRHRARRSPAGARARAGSTARRGSRAPATARPDRARRRSRCRRRAGRRRDRRRLGRAYPAMSPTSKRSPSAPSVRASASQRATTSSLRSRPTISTSRPWTAVSRWCSAKVRYDLPEPKSTTRSGPGGSGGQHVLDELEEAVDLAELVVALRRGPCPRRVITPSSTRNGTGMPSCSRRRLTPIVPERLPRPGRRPAQDGRSGSSGQHLLVGVRRLEKGLPELPADQVDRAALSVSAGARFSSRRPRRGVVGATGSAARRRPGPARP